MRKYWWVPAVVLVMAGSACWSKTLVIDDFKYPDATAAKAAWGMDAAALAPRPAVKDGVKCVEFPCAFNNNHVRAVWLERQKLDLSDCDYIRFRIKIENPLAFRMISIYFQSGEGDNSFVSLWAIPTLTENWQTVTILKSQFMPEGVPPGWNNITGIVLSPWTAAPQLGRIFISEIAAVKEDRPANILPNSSFELCTNEGIPDSWGTGHWGLGVADADGWRKQWGVDDKVSHSGRRSLRLTGKNALAKSMWITLEAGKPHTFSAWMKSGRDNLPVAMAAVSGQSKEFTVGKAWKRYSFTETPTGNSLTGCAVCPQAEGTVWVDDVQLEVSDTATPYHHSVVDSTPPAKAVHRAPRQVPDFRIIPGKSTVSVKVDEHRRLLVNGEPFIPFAPIWESAPTPEIIRDAALAGYNSILFWAFAQPAEQLRVTLDEAQKNGLKVVFWVNANVTDAMLADWVDKLKDHPAIIAWFVIDEPQGISPELQARFDMVKQHDPSRPVYVNYVFYPVDQLGDIASLDDYPVPKYPPAVIASDADQLEGSASKAGKPSWLCMQSTGYAYFINREPTGPEFECMAYIALIHGVRGLFGFAQKPHSKELWDEIRMVSREVRELTPILSSIDGATYPAETTGPIHFTRKHYKGKHYIIAVNSGPAPAKATFNAAGTSASVLFEDRSVAVKDGQIVDRFEGFQRHVYEVE